MAHKVKQPTSGELWDVHAERGRIGKSFLCNLLRDDRESRGDTVRVVRIETRGALPPKRPCDVCIYVDDLDDLEGVVGGVAALFAPVWDALKIASMEGSVLILDWPAGSQRVRTEVYTATRFSQKVHELGMAGTAVAVTTTDPTVMEQAARALTITRQVAPFFRQVLAINEISGRIQRIANRTEQSRVYGTLMEAAQGIPIITVPAIRHHAWAAFEAHGVEMPAVLKSDGRQLAETHGLPELAAEACQTWLSLWWTQMQDELQKVRPSQPRAEAI